MRSAHIAPGVIAARAEQIAELFGQRALEPHRVMRDEDFRDPRIGLAQLDRAFGDAADALPPAEYRRQPVIGERFGKTVFPVSGDIGENYQGMDRKFDLVMFSCCGDYVSMATTISKWSGLLVNNGIACGSQLDKDDYGASTFAIVDIFGQSLSKDNGTTFWSAKVSRNVAKPV